jgi:polyphosphate kinase 2 (PPK2 family)
MPILDQLDYDQAIVDKKTYERELADLQLELLKAELEHRERGGSVVIAFEGWDAAGKGGAIKRLTEKLDPRGYSVWSISAPTDEEKKHHYLWRFWQRLQGRGRWTIFDRTWYGRVLVERVEGFAAKKEWKRAFREINEFERLLVDDDVVLVKVFLAITKEEQLQRFEEREKDPYKRYKIGSEDWRNREHWDAYVEAAEEMFAQTSTERAPWTVVGANRKWNARIRVMRAVLRALGHGE